MAWFSRITRFGDAHLVYGQEARMSCGIACVLMCAFKINKIVPGVQALHRENEICDAYAAASGRAYQPEDKGTHQTHLVTVLNGLNCGTWKWKAVSGTEASQEIIDAVGTTGLGPTLGVNPIILGIDWEKGGAHWVVIDTVRQLGSDHWATICDPWDANVHVTSLLPGHPFRYEAGQGGLAVNFWGTTKADARPYAPDKVGVVKKWGMIYR